MRKYFSLAKKFPFQMFFIILGAVLAFSGLVLASVGGNPFADEPLFGPALLILFGGTSVLLAAKSMRKCQMRQIKSLIERRLEEYFQRSEIWQGLIS